MAKRPTLKDLEQQLGELTQALQRERADAENLRRRHEEQMFGLKEMVKASVVRELLPVIDNFERALKHAPVIQSASEGSKKKNSLSSKADQNGIQKYEDFIKGVQSIVKQFEKTLADMGVERIKTVGELFNPHLHEAVHMEQGEGDHEVVSEELQPGYKLGDEVIRHAMVKVKMEKK